MVRSQLSVYLPAQIAKRFILYAKRNGIDASALLSLLIVREKSLKRLATLSNTKTPGTPRRASALSLDRISAFFPSPAEIKIFDKHARSCDLSCSRAGALLIDAELREKWLEGGGDKVTFSIDPAWSFRVFLDKLYDYYTGSGVQSTGRRLNVIRLWLNMVGRARAMRALSEVEEEFGKEGIAEAMNLSKRSWTDLKAFVAALPDDEPPRRKAVQVFVSYKWGANDQNLWVEKLSTSLRAHGIEALLDKWEVRLGDSFTDYMQEHISKADVILFVITPEAVKAAEAPKGKGGALKFEVQMMNARRMAEGTRIIGVYRSGDRPPRYLRDHRYIDFRNDADYERSLQILVDDILGLSGPPKLLR